MSFNIISLGETSYLDALMFQENFFNAQLEKKAKEKATANHLIFLQHSAVYTLGKSGDMSNLKIPIESSIAEFYKTNRGGDITFHGPGQLVGYPIFNLDSYNLGVKDYVEKLEGCIIKCLNEYGIESGRINGASGVWLDWENDNARKICAIGIKVSRGITMHGFAFNISTDLSYFDNIIPCGLTDKAVTSLEKELGKKISYFEVLKKLILIFEEEFK